MGDSVETVIEGLRGEIPSRMEKEGIPGLAMALVSKGGTNWLGCFGYTDRFKRKRVDRDTLFSLQSTTKTVTTVAFLLAVQDGLVELDDALVEHYPEFHVNSRFGENQYQKISFRHLLSHTSGLAREGWLGGVFEDGSPCTWEEHIRSINGSWLKFPVGRHQLYSNAGMDIVAYALERIIGKPYPEYVQKVLGDPLGVTFHFITTEVCGDPDSAKGHLGGSRSACATPVGLGCGHAHLSIEDQARFVRFLLNLGTYDGKCVLEVGYVEMMRSADREGGYGLGTFVAREHGLELPHHPGGGFGLASEMYWVPEYDAGVAVFCNQEYQGYLSELAKRALSRLLELNGAPLGPVAAPLADSPIREVSPGILSRLVGVYGGILGGATVKFSKGKLVLEYSGKDVELSPRSETVFSAEEPRAVVFGLDGRGEPAHMKLHSSGGVVIHMDYLGRTPEGPGPDRGAWKELEGLYVMSLYAAEALFGAVKVEDDGYLHLKLWGDERLYEHEGHPNLFFMFKGEAVIFEGDRLLFDNIVCRRVDDPTVFLKELEVSRQSRVPDWIINQAVSMLKYLGREGEAERVLQLKRG
jgi:CubicO group peptidase (beta-lactamase class C family)